MGEWLQDVFRGRPFWLNAVMVFCAYMSFVYVPWDIFIKPASADGEVWFGVLLTGTAAKWAALPHWFVYGAGLYGLRRNRPWVMIAGAVYVSQVALSMFLWPIFQYGSLTGFVLGLIAAIPFVLLVIAFWNSREVFARGDSTLRDRYGEWALITGASSGLGLEFARALAREGVSCVLTARREDKLREAAAALERSHGVATRVVPCDLSDPAGPDQLADAVADLQIDILINNAGFGGIGTFEKQDPQRLAQMVNLNCLAPVLLTHRLAGGMKERGRGAIIVVGSVSGRQPLPLHAVYSASKAFDLMFGESLFVEMRSSGVDVLVLEPGVTETGFQDAAGELAHEGESPESVVATALAALGHQPSVISGWWNWIRANFAIRFGSRPLVAYVAREVMRAQTPADRL